MASTTNRLSMSSQDLSHWDRWYEGEPPPWDIGAPQPEFVRLADRGALSGRVLDVGCGTGEHALLAAERGADALGVDVSRVAIELARRKASERDVAARFAVANALELETLGEVFDVAVDSGLFHAFQDDERPRYSASLAPVIRAGGVLFLCCLSDRQSGDWGPRRVSREDIYETFSDGWQVEDLTSVVRQINRPEIQTWTAEAWLATIRRLARPLDADR
jgi:cyclopropane fatty-acyl-phospholipid synthase-like methyltransferase